MTHTTRRKRGRPTAETTWKQARIARALLVNFHGLRIRKREAARAALGNDNAPIEPVLRAMRKLGQPGARVPRGERSGWKLVDEVLAHGYRLAQERGYLAAAIRLAKRFKRRN